MEKQKKYPPLAAIEQLEDVCTKDVWNILDNTITSIRPEDNLRWDEHCYIPIGMCIGIVTQYSGGQGSYDSIVQLGVCLQAFATWRRDKQVYRFPKELELMLYDQATDLIDGELPMDLVYKMPYQSIYIETPYLSDKTSSEQIEGVLVTFDDDRRYTMPELRFLIITDQCTTGYGIALPYGKTMKECMGILNKGLTKEQKAELPEEMRIAYDKIMEKRGDYNRQEDDGTVTLLAKALELVLYICADNAEIIENPEQKVIYRKPKEGAIKDKYREIQKHDCGTEISEKIRNIKAKNAEKDRIIYLHNDGVHGTPKTPHSRRGHWHHYRTGKGRTQLVLKWIAPTFINGENRKETENIITVNKIEK